MNEATQTDLDAETFTRLFSQVFMHLHATREVHEYSPGREALAVLRHLSVAGPVSVNEARQHFRRSQAAMSELLGRLIKRGLLERQSDPKDRRRHLVWLTEAGQDCVLRESRPLDITMLAEVLQRLPPAARQNLNNSLEGLVQAIYTHAQNRRST